MVRKISKKKEKNMNKIIEARMLSKTFSNECVQQHVLKNLDIDIYEGDFTVIMGASGSGKSTLMYALSGIDKPTLGNITCMGEDITKLNNDQLAKFRRKYSGFVFQQNYLNDSMSVLDNIMATGLLVNRNRKEVAQKAKELLERVGIKEESWRKFPTQLSGGEAQRVSIVRALVNSPSIVFADEPTGALNSKSAEAVLDIMTEINDRGQSILMVTHDMKTARRANRILYLKDGVIIDELNLGKYIKNSETRHKELREFLTRMGW